ncbi:MAG: hypothetical protein WC587_03305 [Candidatus Paceibacterota bacterium]
MKNKKLIIFFTAIVLADVAAVFLWFYLYSKIEEWQTSIVKITNDLAFSEANAQNLKLLKNQTEETAGSKEIIDKVFLGKKDIVSFMEYLEKTGKDIGVSVDFSSVKLDDTGQEKPYFQFSLKGKFENVFRFIVLLENIPNQIVFDRMDISKNGENSPSAGEWEANVGMSLASYETLK